MPGRLPIDADAAALDRAIKSYWNERIDDTPHSSDPPGTAEFHAVRDAYRLRKNPYLLRRVDFSAWAGRDVLEIGCGAGLDLVRFAGGGARVTGIDISSAALSLARDYCRVAGVGCTLVEADGAKLPFPDASFDLVYCHGVLSFMRDPAAAIGEAHRVLRPGGQAVLMVYNRRSWMHRLLSIPGAPIGRGHADAPVFRPYSRAEFERVLSRFDTVSVVTERPPPLPAALQAASERWLRPWGWHLLAYCRKRVG